MKKHFYAYKNDIFPLLLSSTKNNINWCELEIITQTKFRNNDTHLAKSYVTFPFLFLFVLRIILLLMFHSLVLLDHGSWTYFDRIFVNNIIHINKITYVWCCLFTISSIYYFTQWNPNKIKMGWKSQNSSLLSL